MRTLVPFLVWLTCCTPLPDGWQGARPVAALVQQECEGSPYEGLHDERIEPVAGEGLDRIAARELHFRCAQDVRGLQVVEGDTVRVLIQPKDMNPRMVAACDCLYDLDITLDVDAPPASVALWRRWDDLNDDNAPVRIGALPGDGGTDTDPDTDPPT